MGLVCGGDRTHFPAMIAGAFEHFCCCGLWLVLSFRTGDARPKMEHWSRAKRLR